MPKFSSSNTCLKCGSELQFLYVFFFSSWLFNDTVNIEITWCQMIGGLMNVELLVKRGLAWETKTLAINNNESLHYSRPDLTQSTRALSLSFSLSQGILVASVIGMGSISGV
jgi:hypothetical protein